MKCLLQSLSVLFFETGSLSLELMDPVRLGGHSFLSPSLFPQALELETSHLAWLLVGSGDPNANPCACLYSRHFTDPSPRLLTWNFLMGWRINDLGKSPSSYNILRVNVIMDFKRTHFNIQV